MFAIPTVSGSTRLLVAAASTGFDYWTVVPSLIGAVAIVGGWLAWFLTRPQRRKREEREEQLTEEISEMGDALSDLKTMVVGLAEEMQGRAPRPQLRFKTKEGTTPALVVRIPSMPTVDVDALVDAEVSTVRATRPPLAKQQNVPADAPEAARGLLETMNLIQGIGNRGLGFRFGASGDKFLPVTDEDYSRFEEALERYAGEVRAFVADWLDYLHKRRVAIPFWTQVDNDGGAPAEEARIKISFPNPCHEAELPERPTLPVRPKFNRRPNPMHRDALSLIGLSVPSFASPRLPDVRPIDLHRDHSGPHYRKGSLEVSYDYDSLPHHDPVEVDPFVVGIPAAGVYSVRWTIGAKNLVHREEGTLQVEVVHEDAATRPVVSLGDLVKARRSATQ